MADEKPTGLWECVHDCHLGSPPVQYRKGKVIGETDTNIKQARSSPLFEVVTQKRLAEINAAAAKKLEDAKSEQAKVADDTVDEVKPPQPE